ncbi:helix-turn-helix domain-containing protein [Planctomycetaceae bacterium SH139]
MALCFDDVLTARAWLCAGHSPRQVADWLGCPVSEVRKLVGQKARRSYEPPPTPSEIVEACRRLRASESDAATLRRDVYQPDAPMRVPVIKVSEIVG